MGNHIDVITTKWVAQDAGIGAGVDSYFEYLVKGAILLQDKELMSMFLGECFLWEGAQHLWQGEMKVLMGHIQDSSEGFVVMLLNSLW